MAHVRFFLLSLFPQLTSIGYESMLGAGTDDKTSYHPRFDFCGKDRADRPDCLFYFKEPSMRHVDQPIPYLIWNGRVVLDYKREAVKAFDLPLTISSQIGQEAAQLEAMLRSDPSIQWTDILAWIVRRGETPQKVSNMRNRLNMSIVRFRILARLLAYDRRSSKNLEVYLFTVMTAEMVVKNTTKALPDVVEGSDEKAYIDMLSLRVNIEDGHADSSEPPKISKESKHPGRQRKIARLKRAISWAQSQSEWEAENPAPTPSIHGQTDCTSIEAIVAFKLGSLDHHVRDGRLVFKGPLTMEHAAPFYDFNNPRMEEFFGSPSYYNDESFLDPDANDPYGLLSSPTVSDAQECLVEFLLEPTRLQYRALTLVNTGSRVYKPIFITNPSDSYWQQLQSLQTGFEQHWAEIGRTAPPPILYGLLKLEYGSMTWNSDSTPVLTVVSQTIDSCTRTFTLWQRQQAAEQRARLFQQQRVLEAEEGDSGADGEEEGQDDLGQGEEGNTVSAELQGEGGEEDLMEVGGEEEEGL